MGFTDFKLYFKFNQKSLNYDLPQKQVNHKNNHT
jgi:hypothetical protein